MITMHTKPRLFSQQAGFTLVELMVSTALGLLLMAGLFQVYLGSKQSYQLHEGMTRLQENGRFAIDVLQSSITMAGYPKSNTSFIAVSGADGTGVDVMRDTFTVSYEADEDCAGNGTGSTGVAVNTFEVKTATTPRKNSSGIEIWELYCNDQPLIEGIEAMQVLYGIDDNIVEGEVGYGTADRYLNATQVLAEFGSWSNNSTTSTDSRIVSVRVALLVDSIEAARVESLDQGLENLKQGFTLLDLTPRKEDPKRLVYKDNIARRVFTTTVLLRNRMP